MKFKKTKRLSVILASMLMLFSTAASITGTVAWFVAANTVTVSNMSIKAEAEQGIVVANETHAAAADWAQSIDVSHNGALTAGQATFVPTSTADAATWYHANADGIDDYTKNENGYITRTGAAITETESGKGVYRIDLDTNDSDDVHVYKNIYLLNSVFVQASATEALADQDLVVKQLTVTSSTSSPALNKALRVLFKAEGGVATPLIYAPLATGATVAHNDVKSDGHGGKIGGTSTITVNKEASGSQTDDVLFDNISIPAYNVAGTNAKQIKVYVYFEGEDFNCKSANIAATLDTLNVSFKLENKHN